MKLTAATHHQPRAPPSACVRPPLCYNARRPAQVTLSLCIVATLIQTMMQTRLPA